MSNTTVNPTAEERAVELLSDYPNAELAHTGGNVYCCRLNLDGDDYLLVTDGVEFDGAEGSYAVGLYLDDDDEGEVLVCSDDAALISHVDKVFAEHVADRRLLVLRALPFATIYGDEEYTEWATRAVGYLDADNPAAFNEMVEVEYHTHMACGNVRKAEYLVERAHSVKGGE
jgi:hypothetical protein